jgi:hypothetical protein
MFVGRIDGALSRLLRALSARERPGRRRELAGGRTLDPDVAPFSGLDGIGGLSDRRPTQNSVNGACHATAASADSRWSTADLLDTVLALSQRAAGSLGNRREGSAGRMRWLELQNKISAYRLFERRDFAGSCMEEDMIRGLDPRARLFAAEGYSYRRARSGASARDLPADFCPIATHAGAGLWLAEEALMKIHAGASECDALAEFAAECQRNAFDGFSGIMEEALGLVARTLYPHLIKRLDKHIRAMSVRFWERFWHGAGRGIYFAPSNILRRGKVRWRGVAMCSNEAPDEIAIQNALSGFCFALTLVNIQHPEIRTALIENYPPRADECADGVLSALTVWALSGGDPETLEPVAAFDESASGARTRRTANLADEERDQPERLFSLRHRTTHRGVITASQVENRKRSIQ